MRFVEALTVASVLRVEVLDLTPFGGALTYVYHRRVQVLDEYRWEFAQAKSGLHTAQIEAQLFKFAVELSQGSRRPYTLRIPPGRFIGHIRYQMGAPTEKDVLLLLGAKESLVDDWTRRLAKDVEGGLMDIAPSYARPEFQASKDAFPPTKKGTADYDEQEHELELILEEAMLGEIFRTAFPNVDYDYEPRQSAVIIGWPNPVIDGIDTSDFDHPLTRPARVFGARRGW